MYYEVRRFASIVDGPSGSQAIGALLVMGDVLRKILRRESISSADAELVKAIRPGISRFQVAIVSVLLAEKLAIWPAPMRL